MIFAIVFGLLVVTLVIPTHARAIIILPAIILIPIAQMVATIIGSLSVPIAGIGLLIKAITKNRKLAIIVSLVMLVVLLVVTVVVLRYKYPDNPWI